MRWVHVEKAIHCIIKEHAGCTMARSMLQCMLINAQKNLKLKSTFKMQMNVFLTMYRPAFVEVHTPHFLPISAGRKKEK